MDSHPFRSEVIKNIDLSDHLPVTVSWAMDKIGAQLNSTKKISLEKIAINADKIVNNNRFSALLHLDSDTNKIITDMHTAAKSVADELNSAAEKNSHFDVTLTPENQYIHDLNEIIPEPYTECYRIPTWEVITAALKSTPNKKSPGIDSIPSEFWKLVQDEEQPTSVAVETDDEAEGS
ncbi:hypothetical protein AYI70_g11112 [Smittium culicis]|uniref:Uncharacterized protein n=1 Tax=Smittium culicis TaxID=133412 RepID=A0A1R1X3B5_9FUNG|nr:hypothetical protein AYI70_g11112 [Smittium culicis]